MSPPAAPLALTDKERANDNTLPAIDTLLRATHGPLHDKLTALGEEGITPGVCLRWLRARQWNVPLAAKCLTEHCAWREKYLHGFPINEAGIRRVSDEAVALDLGRSLTYVAGKDRHNRPCVVVVGGNHVPQEAERTKRFIVYVLDAAVAWGKLQLEQACEQAAAQGTQLENDAWDGRLVGMFDLSNFGYANADLSALKAVFDLLQNHYVERLYRLYLYSAPMIFLGLWKVVSPLLDPRSREKVVFVEKKNVKDKVLVHFEEQSMPAFLGGSSKSLPCNEVWRLVEDAHKAKQAKQLNGKEADENGK